MHVGLEEEGQTKTLDGELNQLAVSQLADRKLTEKDAILALPCWQDCPSRPGAQ